MIKSVLTGDGRQRSLVCPRVPVEPHEDGGGVHQEVSEVLYAVVSNIWELSG